MAKQSTLRAQELRVKQYFERENKFLPQQTQQYMQSNNSKFLAAQNKRISAASMIQSIENQIR